MPRPTRIAAGSILWVGPLFFILSKIAGFFLQPLNFSILLVAAGVAAGLSGFRLLGIGASLAGCLLLMLSAWTSLGALMLEPLEDRFPRPALPPENVAGIIILGGGFEGAVNLVRGGYELNSSGDRFVEAAILARRYPDAKLVVSGDKGVLIGESEGDATTAPRLFTAFGVARDRLILEGRSRNTDENARFTKELVQPKPGETWLLVTSAFHMPRSVALFRKSAFPVVPWPTDYRTTGRKGFGFFGDNSNTSLQITTAAIREWIGLIAYRLSGRTDTLLPLPDEG